MNGNINLSNIFNISSNLDFSSNNVLPNLNILDFSSNNVLSNINIFDISTNVIGKKKKVKKINNYFKFKDKGKKVKKLII